MKKTAIGLLLITALLTSCGKAADSMNHADMTDMAGSSGQASAAETDHGSTDHVHGHGAAQGADVSAKFALSPELPKPNEDTTLTIRVQDPSGKPIDRLDTVHEKKMHVIVVSRDLSYFNHIHPADQGNGAFAVTTRFPAPGAYKVIADFTPTGMGAMNQSQWVTVSGTAPEAQPVEPETDFTKMVDGKKVTLTFDHLTAHEEVNLNFNIKDAQTGEAVTDLQPYLGAVGHVVILSRDTESYLHVHPAEESAAGPDARFMTAFPRSGVYKIWGQFQQEGRVFTVPFVVKVP